MPLSPEVEKFLARLKPETRAALVEKLQPDVITLLASIENPALADRLNAGGEHTEMLFAILNQTLDGTDELLRRQADEAFVETATGLENLRSLLGTLPKAASGE